MKYIVNQTKCMELIQNWKRKGWYLNQSEKADLLGVSTSVVNRLQNGNKKFNELKAEQFLKFAEMLQVHPMELMEKSK